MAKIHGIVYIIIGGAVAFASWAMSFESLKFFFYVGCVFVIIGMFKLVFKGMSDKEDKKIQKYKEQKQASANNQIRQQPQRQINMQYKRCHTCGNVMYARANFCSVCGTRI